MESWERICMNAGAINVEPENSCSGRGKTLLLDACGVLVGEPTGPLFTAVAESCNLRPDDVAKKFRKQFRDDLWSGRIDPATFWNGLAQACGTDEPLPSWCGIVHSSMQPLPSAQRLYAWSRQADLVMISNHRHEWLLPCLERLGISRHVTEIRISSQTGLVKPDLAAYENALEGRAYSNTMYVDDKKANIAAVSGLPLRACLADGNGQWIREVDAWLAS